MSGSVYPADSSLLGLSMSTMRLRLAGEHHSTVLIEPPLFQNELSFCSNSGVPFDSLCRDRLSSGRLGGGQAVDTRLNRFTQSPGSAGRGVHAER
jgi:hypothetical protein